MARCAPAPAQAHEPAGSAESRRRVAETFRKGGGGAARRTCAGGRGGADTADTARSGADIQAADPAARRRLAAKLEA